MLYGNVPRGGQKKSHNGDLDFHWTLMLCRRNVKHNSPKNLLQEEPAFNYTLFSYYLNILFLFLYRFSKLLLVWVFLYAYNVFNQTNSIPFLSIPLESYSPLFTLTSCAKRHCIFLVAMNTPLSPNCEKDLHIFHLPLFLFISCLHLLSLKLFASKVCFIKHIASAWSSMSPMILSPINLWLCGCVPCTPKWLWLWAATETWECVLRDWEIKPPFHVAQQ